MSGLIWAALCERGGPAHDRRGLNEITSFRGCQQLLLPGDVKLRFNGQLYQWRSAVFSNLIGAGFPGVALEFGGPADRLSPPDRGPGGGNGRGSNLRPLLGRSAA